MNDAKPSPPLVGRSAMTFGRWFRLARKELRETLRDRRTIITLLLMPLLVYPLLSLAFRQFLFSAYQAPPRNEWTVGVPNDEDYRVINQLLSEGDKLLRAAARDDASGSSRSPLQELILERLDWRIPIDLEEGLREGVIDVGIRLEKRRPRSGNADSEPFARCEILYRGQSPAGVDAAHYLERRLQALNEADFQRRLAISGLAYAPITEFRLSEVRKDEGFSFSLSTLVPLILILMTITGAVYPAIDLTAGERERGTLESLIASPAPRFAMLLAKYVAVLTVAILTALMNITAMTVTVFTTGLAASLFGAGGLSAASLLAVLGLMVLFAAFFSAVLLALTSFARSFKEAQAYLVPLMLVAMTPGFLSVFGMQLKGWWAVTPLANIVLLARDVLERGPDPTWAIVALASTLIYGLSALVLAANTFGNDAILYGSQDSWGDWVKPPRRISPAPTMPIAVLTLALIFPLQVWVMGLIGIEGFEFLGLKIVPSMQQRFVIAGMFTVALYFVLPTLVALWRRIEFVSGFNLRAFSPVTLIGALILGCSLWPPAHELVLFSQWLGLSTISEEKRQAALKSIELMRTLPLFVPLLCTAVAPAVCEEFFFRGFLLSALRRTSKPATAILLNGIIFGLCHLISPTGFSVERLFATTMLGCILAWIAYRANSVYPGMVLHALHNGLVLTVAYYANKLEGVTPPLDSAMHLPKLWQAAGLLGVAIGVGFVWLGTRGTQRDETH